MLDVALRFERAFKRYHEEDPYFERNLVEREAGERPMKYDWLILEGLVEMFEIFPSSHFLFVWDDL